MRLEPFVLYRYHLTPDRIHSIWGEFKPLGATYPPDPQLGALDKSLNRLRGDFASCVLFLDEFRHQGPPPALMNAPQLHFESRFGLQEHNGGMWEYDSVSVRLLDVSGPNSVDFAGLVSSETSAAVFYLRTAQTLSALRELFDRVRNLGTLRAELLSVAAVYIGFDHDAFFTLETRDDDLYRDALQSANPQDAKPNMRSA